jgi:hypothetical protein
LGSCCSICCCPGCKRAPSCSCCSDMPERR